MSKWKVYKGKYIITNNKPSQADCIATCEKKHARLIAAAPDLLEALETLLYTGTHNPNSYKIVGTDDNGRSVNELGMARVNARKAIALAR